MEARAGVLRTLGAGKWTNLLYLTLYRKTRQKAKGICVKDAGRAQRIFPPAQGPGHLYKRGVGLV